MRKIFSLIIAITLFASLLKAQIPNATQQPKWYMPVYIHDATGQRDTVYYGYDPSANSWATFETNFGEVWQDTSSAFAATVYINTEDSLLKADVRDSATMI